MSKTPSILVRFLNSLEKELFLRPVCHLLQQELRPADGGRRVPVGDRFVGEGVRREACLFDSYFCRAKPFGGSPRRIAGTSPHVNWRPAEGNAMSSSRIALVTADQPLAQSIQGHFHDALGQSIFVSTFETIRGYLGRRD